MKDPLTWHKSMCRMPYAVRFNGGMRGCRSTLATSENTVNWQENCSYRYPSLIHLWSEWHREYVAMRLPRLMVRYEDLLFDGQNTVGALCDCFGGKRTRQFRIPSGPVKTARSHSPASDLSTALKRSNWSNRLDGLRSADVKYFRTHADNAILRYFGYSVPMGGLMGEHSRGFSDGKLIVRRMASPPAAPTSALNATRFQRVPTTHGIPIDFAASEGKGRRLLHVISSLASTNTLGRDTIPGSSRLPMMKRLLRATVDMCSAGFNVTVVLAAAWAAEGSRAELTDSLSGCVAPLEFGIWETNAARGDLPSKHRQLVAELLPKFDVISCWEDDMLSETRRIQTRANRSV